MELAFFDLDFQICVVLRFGVSMGVSLWIFMDSLDIQILATEVVATHFGMIMDDYDT